MKTRSKQKFSLVIIVVLACALAVAYFFYRRVEAEANNKNSQDKTYAHLVTPKDRAPLVIPPDVVQRGRTVRVPILMYHHVGELPPKPNATRKDLTVPTADFEAEVKWLADNGYTSIKLEDIYQYSLGKFTMPKKPVVFTFDDGYQDVFTNAVPILKKYGFVGSFAVITQWPGQTMGDNVYASWHDINLAYRAGNEIVSHTQNHFDGSNPKYNSDYIATNLGGSFADIQDNLGFRTNILIYPYGHYTDKYIGVAKEAGFVMGLTVHMGKIINLDDLMNMPRVRVHGAETLQRFEEIITK